MKRTSLRINFYFLRRQIALAFLGLFLFETALGVNPPSYRQPHPLNWIFGTPVGETPGWSEPYWTNFEFSVANLWNSPMTMTNIKTGDKYQYFVDYEQTSAISEFGFQLKDKLAFALEVPYAYRGGGFLDDFIDVFHQTIGNRRFNRNFYDSFRTIYSVKTNGVEYYDKSLPLRGVSNLKAKLKWWFYKQQSPQKGGGCPCGAALSFQMKAPVQDPKYGGTNGKFDPSILLHLGTSIGRTGGIWFTAGYSRLSENPAMKNWPLKKNHSMYELAIDIPGSDEVGVIGLARIQSPYFSADELAFTDLSADPAIVSRNRASSGYSSLVHWQGTESLGLRYRPTPKTQINLSIAEDWAIGPYDTNDNLYCNGAPDVNFILQAAFDF